MRVSILILLLCLGCQSNQLDSGPILEEEVKPVVRSENKGPCACCGGGACECEPTPCTDLEVVFENTGTGLDGTYTAEWQSTGTPRWTFNTGGCDWEIIASGSGGGVAYLREVGGTCQLTGTCKQSSGTATITIEPNIMECDFCELGHLIGSTIKISWPCWYPQYFKILTPFPDGSCDCSGITDLEVPLSCSAPTAPPCLFLYFLLEVDCVETVSIVYDAEVRTLKMTFLSIALEDAIYENTNVSTAEFYGGGPIDLTLTLNDRPLCDWPSTVQIQGFNNGNWCP